jgi:hypothetical protein
VEEPDIFFRFCALLDAFVDEEEETGEPDRAEMKPTVGKHGLLSSPRGPFGRSDLRFDRAECQALAQELAEAAEAVGETLRLTGRAALLPSPIAGPW